MNTLLFHIASHCQQARRISGFSLVELMIAMTSGLLLVAGLATFITNNNTMRTELEKTGRQIENGRYAMEILTNAFHHAGYYGLHFDLGEPSTTPPDPCATTVAALNADLNVPFQGYDAPTTVPAPLSNCLQPANHLAGTDILVVRRAQTSPTPLEQLESDQVYLQATSSAHVLATGADSTVFNLKQKDKLTPADVRKFIVQIYFVSPCSRPSDGTTCDASADVGQPIPTLKRLELSEQGQRMDLVPLVEGVENLQVDYGIDHTGDGSPDCYTKGPEDIQNCATLDDPTWLRVWSNFWPGVMMARIYLLMRNVEPTQGYSDDKQYALGLAGTVTAASAVSNYKRHVYTASVRLTNLTGRREN